MNGVEYTKKGEWIRPHGHTKTTAQPMFDGLQGVMFKGFFRIEAHSKNLGWQNQGFQKPGFSGTRIEPSAFYAGGLFLFIHFFCPLGNHRRAHLRGRN